MPIEGDNAAVDPANAQPETAQPATGNPADDVLHLMETESAAGGSSGTQQADPGQPDEVEATHAESGSDEPQVASAAPLPSAEADGNTDQQTEQIEAGREPVEREAALVENSPLVAVEPEIVPKRTGYFQERPPEKVDVAPRVLRRRTRREVLLFGAGALAALAAGGSLLPQATLNRLGVIHDKKPWPGKEWLLNRALRIDDDVAEALYSQNRLVPTYTKAQITPLKNNYNGATPDPSYIPEWHLELRGLASGLSVSLSIRNLLTRFQMHDQITRFVCVEGWSAIAWWSGLRFDDLLQAYPPVSQARWIRVESSVNLDPWGNPDPYFVSLDIPTARQPQTLLATHFNGQPLTVDHGAPVRLIVPVKLGLKNVKAVTRITYLKEQPKDYWAERGYSRYDGI
jgi:DMSO/TMAO reductase YedYZ molybdopterin-dependent catalytic subunit